MLNSLIGKKTYQSQGFLQDGTRVPLTGVKVSGNIVTQIKTSDKEGYNSIQLGIDAKKRSNKAILGHANKALVNASKQTQTEKSTKDNLKTQNTTATSVSTNVSQANSLAKASSVPKYFREVRLEDVSGFDLGSEINVAEVFAAGDVIDVTGVSKGKGWAGGVKRYHFKGGPRTHGQSDRERAPGSIGQTTTPGRVYKGKKMAGRMGTDTVTVKNLEIIEVTDDGVLLVKGLVPGRINGLLMVKKVGENKKFVPLYKEVTSDEDAGRSSVSEDAKQISEEVSNAEPVSLNESQPAALEETPEISTEAALDSSENTQVSTAQESVSDSSEDEQSPAAQTEEEPSEEAKKEEDK